MSELHEETLSSERPFKGRRLSVRVDMVQMPSGREVRREVVEHPDSIAAVALLPGDMVILVRQWRHATGHALLELPAGTLDPGETLEETARRELQEEIGYEPGSLRKLGSLYLAPGYSAEEIHLFLAEDLEPNAKEPDADENLEVVKLPLQTAIEMARKGELRDAKTVAGLLTMAELRRAEAAVESG